MGHVDNHNFLVVVYLTKEKYIMYSVNRLNDKLVKFEHEILKLFKDIFRHLLIQLSISHIEA